MMTGAGGNGKDCLFNLLRAALGEYSYTGSIAVLLKPMSDGPAPEVANMHKKRVVIYSEPPKDCKLIGSVLKILTGSSEVNARGLYANNTTTKLHSTNIINCNEIPIVDDMDEALARRLIVIPFDVLFKSKREIATMDEDTPNLFEKDEYYTTQAFTKKYRREFLLLLTEHFKLFAEGGYKIDTPPKACEEAANDYMAEADEFNTWLSQNYKKAALTAAGKVDKEKYVRVADIYDLLKESDLWDNWTKRERRKMTSAKMAKNFKKSPVLRLYFKDRIRPTIDGAQRNVRNVLVGWEEILPEVEEAEEAE
jgi:phage/plasmid-associated DNA primase